MDLQAINAGFSPVDIRYVKSSLLNDAYRVIQYADLISQKDGDSRFVLYRDSLNEMLDDIINDDSIYFDKDDLALLTDIAEEHNVDKDGSPAFPDWYIFE